MRLHFPHPFSISTPLSFLICCIINGYIVYAQPAQVPFSNCSSPDSDTLSPNQFSISQVYAQVTRSASNQRYLNVTFFGTSPADVFSVSNDSHLLATMFTTTSVFTATVASFASAFCDHLRPSSPLPSIANGSTNYCPVPAGPIAFSTATPLNHVYELLSVNTRIRVVDASTEALELLCLDVSTSVLKPGLLGSVYGHAVIIFWTTVSIAIGYWLVVGGARVSAAWKRGASTSPRKFWSHFQRAGFVLASAISGEQLASQPALLRFCTPSMRDVLFHAQWCAALGMVAVQWPTFAYGFFAQVAWSTLTYNITLTQGLNASFEHWNPLSAPSFTAPGGFTDQVTDPSSPIYIDSSIPNDILSLPSNTRTGMEAFAFSTGIRPQDLFGICMGVFLMIIAGTVAVTLLIWAVDKILSKLTGASREKRYTKDSRSPRWSITAKEILDDTVSPTEAETDGLSGSAAQREPSHLFGVGRVRKLRLGYESFHWDILWGNLIRILLLFHLPITIFSSFQLSRPRSEATLLSIVLSALSFAGFSVLLPLCLLLRLITTRTNKLYDDTRTLLSLGPLYNQYASGSRTFAKLLFIGNLAFGVVIGCGQRSGTAQAIIILIMEVISALWTSVYLPWGRGAAMGAISFFVCVCRIITGVLLVILSPAVSVGISASGWIACAVLLLQALVFGLFLILLLVKLLEGALRSLFRISFGRSRRTRQTGLLGTVSQINNTRLRPSRTTGNQTYQLTKSGARSSLSSQDVLGHSLADKGAPSYVEAPRGPPSVLRADQVKTPYKEEADDEGGHILGAWPPQYEMGESSEVEPNLGFTRVRGGRANFDTPYAIMNSSSQRFRSTSSRSAARSIQAPTSSAGSSPSLPPGAMQSGMATQHTRKKSQTAVIGDMDSFDVDDRRMHPHGSVALPTPSTSRVVAAVSQADNDGEEDEEDSDSRVRATKGERRRWFSRQATSSGVTDPPKTDRWAFLRGRRRSEGDGLALEDEEVEEPPMGQGGRSFVVIRDTRPSIPSPVRRPA